MSDQPEVLREISWDDSDDPDGEEAPSPDVFGDEHLTDLGNARRLVARHGRDLRHVKPWGRQGTWLVWDGRRWARDLTGETERRAIETVRSILDEAAAERDSAKRKALGKWALDSESRSRINAMIELAANLSDVVAGPGDFDADPWLLCVRNGVIDLRTGELLPHDRVQMISRLTSVTHDPSARSDVWDQFLEAALPDEEERAFLKRVAGYSLSGKTTEEVLLFCHGPKYGGKTTFLEAFKRTLGDYAATADFSTFLRGRPHSGDAPRADLLRLYGRRLVGSVEVEEGRKLAEGLIKQLTGGDTVVARGLYETDAAEAPMQFTLWLAANQKPKVTDDAATWRRILLVPFARSIPNRDPRIKEALLEREHRPAILAWAVGGCLEWQRRGLDPPEVVRRATDQWEEESNPLYGFTGEEGPAVLDPGAWTSSAALWSAYRDWAGKDGAIESQRGLGLRVKDLGLSFEWGGPRGKTRGWRGIRLGEDGIQERWAT